MKKEVFSQFSSISLMLPLKFIVMNTFHSVLDQTVYLLCRKVWEYKSYTGMKKSKREKIPVQGAELNALFASLLWKLAYYRENQPALVVEYIKILNKSFGQP